MRAGLKDKLEHIGAGVQFKLGSRFGTEESPLGKEVVLARVLASIRGAVVHILGGGVSPPARVFRHAGMHEMSHRAHGLHLWYRFDVAEVEGDGDGDRARRVLACIEALKELKDELDDSFRGEAIGDEGAETQLGGEKGIRGRQLGHASKLGKGKPVVEAAEAELKYKMLYQSNDPMLVQQKTNHYDLIKLTEAWNIEGGDPSVVVQVIDSGIDTSHPDLQKNRWLNPGETCGNGVDDDGNGYVDDCGGYNHADDSGTDLMGSSSHGTHCAGTIAADSDNGVGVAGVAGGKAGVLGGRGVSLMISTVFGQQTTSGFAEALVYGADNGAHVCSNRCAWAPNKGPSTLNCT